MTTKLTKVRVVLADLPSYSLKATQDVIDRARFDSKRNCIIGIAVREQIPGSSSIAITKHEIRFNKDVELDGELVSMRHVYRNPLMAARKAEQFDIDGDKRGSEFARKQQAPFDFRLQGRDATLKVLVKQPSGKNRKKRGSNVVRLRAATQHEKVVNCDRRYHLPKVRAPKKAA